MSFRVKHDFFDNPIVPPYILCKSNKERIGVLKCTSKDLTVKFNSLDEISFTTYLYHDNIKNNYYDNVEVMKYVLLPGIGFYAIDSVFIQSKGTKIEHKKVTAISYECLMGQKYLENFTINMGTVESIDGVQFYNLAAPDKSLLHLVLEKCPDWTIGHIDVALRTTQRSFEVTKQDVYSFMTTDVSEAFECIFLFDTVNNTINVYQEKNVGKDTDIYVSYNNLLKSTNISSNVSDIKTCLTLTGTDDLNIREINMGYDRIYNLDFYNSMDYMSKSLFNAYNKWIKKRLNHLNSYNSLLSQYENYYSQINELTHLKMPSTANSTNWNEYGLVPLQEQLASYEQKQAVMMKSGWGDPSNANYSSKYLPVFNTINTIKSHIFNINNQLNDLKNSQSQVLSRMNTIISDVSMIRNFTLDQLKELTTFIREEELSTNNFVVTDIMTDEERFEMLHEFLKYGEKELFKVSIPQLSFSADMVNLFAIPEFRRFNGDFDVGNYIHVSMRDDYLIKARLLEMRIDFLNVENFSVVFGNIVKQGKMAKDFTNAFKQAQSAATSVSFNASHWNQANRDTSTIGKILDEGLIAAGKYLKNGDDSEFIIDKRGIFVNTTSGQYAGKDSIFFGGGRLFFSDDNWETVSMSVGRADVTIKGVTESRFGTFADFVLAGYIGGSVLEGDEIYGGLLQSLNYAKGKIGSLINLNNGTFEFNANNESKLTLDGNGVLTVKGIIKAEEGWIGGKDAFIIKDGKLYSGKDSFSSSTNGVYIGINGIALGANNTFTVDPQGNLTATAGSIGGWKIGKNNIYNGVSFFNTKSNNSCGMGKTQAVSDSAFWAGDGKYLVRQNGYIHAEYGDIGGATIRNDSIRASNDNWWIASNGSASFKDVHVSGVQSGSNFGSVNYSNGTTWGNFSGASYFGSNVGSPFGGTCINHIQSISADYIQANYLDAINANIENLRTKDAEIENLVATKASIEDLDAATARIGKLEAKKITVSDLNVSGSINGHDVKWRTLSYVSGVDLHKDTTTINGQIVLTNLTSIGYALRHLYILADDYG